MAVTGHHARLGTRLRARLCRGRHLRRLSSRCFSRRNPHRSGRARFGHPAPVSGDNVAVFEVWVTYAVPRHGRAGAFDTPTRHRVRGVCSRTTFPRPGAFPPSPPPPATGFVRGLRRYYAPVRLLPPVHHRLRPSGLPDAGRPATAGRSDGRSPGSRARSVRTCWGLRPRRASPALASRAGPCRLPQTQRRRRPGLSNFRGSIPSLCVPLSTLRRAPRGAPRMTRGRCGSLRLHRDGL